MTASFRIMVHPGRLELPIAVMCSFSMHVDECVPYDN